VTKPINVPMLLARIEAQLSMRRKTKRMTLSLGKLGPGSVLDGRYELAEEIGRGGFSVVYKAKQVSTGQQVAIKLIRPELAEDAEDPAKERDRFVQELKIIGSLNHPHIVRLVDAGALAEGHVYTVLEFVQGPTLHELIRAQGPLDPVEAVRLMLQVLEALSCAHGHGVIHLDLKPQNIMVVSTGARRSAMVLDFGLAEMARQGQFLPEQLRGTPSYMSPEHLRKEPLSANCDLYAWGLIFIECLTGEVAIQRASRGSIILEHLSPRQVPLSGRILDPALRKLIEKAVAKDPRRRYASAEQLMADLEALALSPEAVAPAPTSGAGSGDTTLSLPGERDDDDPDGTTRTPAFPLS
jgi:serine/threonine protein kinase